MTATILLLALKSFLVAAATLALLRLTRTRSAAERSTIAHLGLFALIALPLGSLALPTLALSLPAPLARITSPDPAPKVTARAVQREQAAPIRASASPAAAPVQSSLATTVADAAKYAYLLPTLVLLALTLAALLRLVGLRARAEVLVDPVWLSALARAQRRMGFKNGTALLKSDELGSPVSWGLMRPIILLNDAAVLAPEQAEAIIAHELAHVVQLDWAKLILARVATAAFWFNPLAWLLAREAHQLREEAADDAVLAANIAGPDYAELLIGVARHQCRGALLGAHGVAPSRSSLGRRVKRVLDKNPARGPSGRSWVAGFAMGMLSMAVPLAAVTIAPGRATLQVARPGQALVTVASPTGAGSVGTMHDIPGRTSAIALANAGARANDGISNDGARTTAREAIVAARPATSVSAAPRQQSDIDQLIGMRAVGITAEYQRGMAEAGFPGLTADQLTGAHAVGVTPAYASAMRATGMSLNINDLIGARAIDLDPVYIAAMRRFGINGTLDDYQGMRSVGVTADFVRRLRAEGINATAPDKLTALRAVSAGP